MANQLNDKAVDILEKKLSQEGMRGFLEISEDMEKLFNENPSPTREQAVTIISEYFKDRGESEKFIRNWLEAAELHCKTYGIDGSELPKAMLADLGMFRFMSFLEEQGLSEDEIFAVFSGAAEQTTEHVVRVSDEETTHQCSCKHGHSNDSSK
ncbi:MAG: RidA family protein [Chlorobiales bacterium]|nr:RidA family protein [Chlorobiales bacterium]